MAYKSLLPDAEYDGVHVGGCVTLHERSDSKEGVQTLIHESGHLLGLPDYYNYTTQMYEDGLDAYDMMMDNVGDHNAFSKWLLGWIGDDEIKKVTLDDKDTVSEDVTLESLSKATENGMQYKCAIVAPKNAGMFSEYLLVEYDTELENQTGLIYHGKKLPDGFRVFHVNAKLDSENNFVNSNNDYKDSKLIQLVDKDKNEKEYHNYDYDKDLPLSAVEVAGMGEEYGCKYLEGDSLTPETTPSTNLEEGQIYNKSGISFTGIHPAGEEGKVSIRVDKVEPTKDDLKVTIEEKWQDLDQNNVILLPVTLSGAADRNEEKLPYLIGKDGNKITGKLVEGETKGKYFIIICADVLKAGEYECVLPEGAFSLGTTIESDEQKVSVHVSDSMELKVSDTLNLTNSFASCAAEDSGWYILAAKESDETAGYLYKISEKGKVTEQEIDIQNWKDTWGYAPEHMGEKALECLADGTLVVIFEDYLTDEQKYVHIDDHGKVLDDVVIMQGYDWESHTVGNTIKVKKTGEDDPEIYSIEFGKETKKIEYQGRKTYRFLKEGYLTYSLENRAAEDSEENEMWAIVEYRNARDELTDTWECPYGEEDGQISLASIDGAVETDTAIYLMGLNPKESSVLRDHYMLSDMYLELYAIDKKTGKFSAVEVKGGPLRAGVYKDNYADLTFSDISEEDGKILFSINSWFSSGAASVDDTYCVDLNQDGAITKRIGYYYSTASVLSGAEIMEVDWSGEHPNYQIYDAKEKVASENPESPENPEEPEEKDTDDKKLLPGKDTGDKKLSKGSKVPENTQQAKKTGTKTAKKAANVKTGDTSGVGVYGILLCISGSIAVWCIWKRKYRKER